MQKNLLITSIIVLILYYFFSFLISFTMLTKAVANNDSVLLKNYINEDDLRNSFLKDFYEFSSNLISFMDKKIKIKSESIELTGKLSSTFLKKLFLKISNNISEDFSNPETMLYFYLNSNEIKIYLNKSFSHFGKYSFEKYLLQKKQILKINRNIEVNSNIVLTKEEKENILSNLALRIQSRFKSINYFFLISPIHFKMDVNHQNIRFIVILKFNGFVWKVQKIKIPYSELIDLKDISLDD